MTWTLFYLFWTFLCRNHYFQGFQSIYQLLLGGSDGIFANIEVWNIYKLNILGEKKKSSHVTKGSFSSVSRPVGSSEMTNTMKFFKQIHIYIAQFQKVHVGTSSTKKTEDFSAKVLCLQDCVVGNSFTIGDRQW